MGRKSNATLLNELNNAVMLAVEKGIDEVGRQLEIAYGRCIDRFYADYPFTRVYNRTFSLYAGSDTWDNPLKNKKKINKQKYSISVNVSADYLTDNIGGNPYSSPVDYVFERAYEQGIHGMTPEEAANKKLDWHKLPMSPPPIHFMEKEYERLTNKGGLDIIFGEAISKELARMK